MIRLIRLDGQWLRDGELSLTVPSQLVDSAVIEAMRPHSSLSLEFAGDGVLIESPERCYASIAECLDILPPGQYCVVWEGLIIEEFEVGDE